MSGGANDDLLIAGEGSDGATGDAGNDRILGQLGDDELYGGTGLDRLFGGSDDDLLFGDAGDDLLRGGYGDDVLTGGAGNDQLAGNSGADVFDFNAAADSLASGGDVILDFARGADLIDLVDAAAGTAVFRGTQAFLGGSRSSVRIVDAGDNLVVQVDADGNGTADMRILLINEATLSAADFLL